MTRSVSAWLRCSAWNAPSGSPASRRHSSNRSAHSGVCAECLRTTTLPAMSAGTTLFTAMR